MPVESFLEKIFVEENLISGFYRAF